TVVIVNGSVWSEYAPRILKSNSFRPSRRWPSSPSEATRPMCVRSRRSRSMRRGLTRPPQPVPPPWASMERVETPPERVGAVAAALEVDRARGADPAAVDLVVARVEVGDAERRRVAHLDVVIAAIGFGARDREDDAHPSAAEALAGRRAVVVLGVGVLQIV